MCARNIKSCARSTVLKTLNRAQEIPNCAQKIQSRAHEILIHAHDILSCAHEILNSGHEILSRAHEILSRVHEIINRSLLKMDENYAKLRGSPYLPRMNYNFKPLSGGRFLLCRMRSKVDT